MALRPFDGWITTDGSLFALKGDAEKYEGDYQFRKWCNENICVGGEWTSQMVAHAILEHWKVARASELSASEGASGTPRV